MTFLFYFKSHENAGYPSTGPHSKDFINQETLEEVFHKTRKQRKKELREQDDEEEELLLMLGAFDD